IPLSDITLKWMMCKAKAAGLPIDAGDIPSWKSPVTAEPQPHPKLPISVRTVGAVDRSHYSVASLPDWTNPPKTSPRETEADEQTAEQVGQVSVATLPPEIQRQLADLLAAASARAKALEITVAPAAYDHLMYLFQSRLSLMTDENSLDAGRNA